MHACYSNKNILCRSFVTKILLGLLLLGNMLGAQEISDKSNSLFVAPGAEIYETPPPAPSAKQRKTASKTRIAKQAAGVAKHKTRIRPEKARDQADAQNAAHMASIGFTPKETARITLHQQEARYGILVPGPAGKAKGSPGEIRPAALTKILSVEDFIEHKYLYNEFHKPTETLSSSSCRPPPVFPSAQIIG